MSISYEGIGQVTVTFLTEETAPEGKVIKMKESDTVALCAAGEAFCGVAGKVAEDGYVAAQVKGFVTVGCADTTVGVGCMDLTADGEGGVKAAGEGDAAVHVLVVKADTDSIVICL